MKISSHFSHKTNTFSYDEIVRIFLIQHTEEIICSLLIMKTRKIYQNHAIIKSDDFFCYSMPIKNVWHNLPISQIKRVCHTLGKKNISRGEKG